MPKTCRGPRRSSLSHLSQLGTHAAGKFASEDSLKIEVFK